jgi:3-hydroxyisobutyrate dehydrogenase-like beta-hydroxyacid dehydrogenase
LSEPALAFLGLGAMGRPIAVALTEAGYDVRAWNRTHKRAEDLVGAVACGTPREAAERAGIVLTMLSDDEAVKEVALGPDGIRAGLREGGVHVGLSTTSIQLAAVLTEAHAAAGQHYVAGPVFGRPAAAASKALWVVAGGPADVLDRCRPILEAIGRGVHLVASAEQAAAVKLAGNFLLAAEIEAFGEALALAESSGLAPERLAETLLGTVFESPVTRVYWPLIADRRFVPAGLSMRLGLKDAELILAAARNAGVDLPIARLVRSRLAQAVREGRGAMDWAALTEVSRSGSL